MPLTFFTSDNKCRGTASHWGVNSKENRLYLTLKKQDSWDEERNVGTFQGAHCSIALSVEEIGKLINFFESGGSEPIELIRSYQNSFSKLELSKKTFLKNDVNVINFLLKIEKSDDGFEKWITAFNVDKAAVIKRYLYFSLEHIFTAIYSDDKKKAIERKKNREEEEKNKPQEYHNIENGEIVDIEKERNSTSIEEPIQTLEEFISNNGGEVETEEENIAQTNDFF